VLAVGLALLYLALLLITTSVSRGLTVRRAKALARAGGIMADVLAQAGE
jgi:hypothetical protein